MNQHLILFVYLNQLLLVYNNFWCVHSLTNICGIAFVLPCCQLLYFFIILIQNQLTGHTIFFIDIDVIITNNTFGKQYLNPPYLFQVFSLFELTKKHYITSCKVWFEKISILACCAFILTFCFLFIPIHWCLKSFTKTFW